MEVLVTGGDTDLGRTIAESFRDAGHRVVITGARRDDLEVAAKELDVDAIVCDNTDPASLEEARSLFPHHLDTIVNVPAPLWEFGRPAHLHAGRPRGGLAQCAGRDDALHGADRPDSSATTCAPAVRSSASSRKTRARAVPTPRSRRPFRTGPRDRPPTSAPVASPSTRSHPAAALRRAMPAWAARHRWRPRSPGWRCF